MSVSVEEEVSTVRRGRPHLVILGAGASRAACPNGDKNGNRLPLMGDLAETVGIKTMLQEWGIDCGQNFEDIYSDLHEKRQTGRLEEIERAVRIYFWKLELAAEPTLYDHLVLSLREDDVIATFNWDPLLWQAAERNTAAGFKAPRLLFLHGNVEVGYCKQDRTYGAAGGSCQECGAAYEEAPLLYPVRQKNYDLNPFIKSQWVTFQRALENMFMLTIFGYGGPRTDVEARTRMENAWERNQLLEYAETAFIVGPDQRDEEVEEAWGSIIHSHHYQIARDFYESFIANHPRRTGEAFYSQYFEAKVISKNPIPRHLGFAELHGWFSRLGRAEEAGRTG